MEKIFFLFLVITISCNQPAKHPEHVRKKIPVEFKLNKSDYAILPFDKSWTWIPKKARPATLSEAELIEIEKVLEKAVKENNEKQQGNPQMQIQLEDKKRQYIPYINEKGEKLVWINFFCYDPTDNKAGTLADTVWLTEPVIVFDGGNCYFSILINLTTRSYSNLSINGYA